MKLSTLDYLVCILCKGSLLMEETESLPTSNAEGKEIITGSLKCKQCGKGFAIVRGVPRLVDHTASSSADINTGDKFANAWKEFSRLDDSYRQQFFDWIFPVDPLFIKDKLVLEAGCGKGRHAQIVADAGARQVLAIDIGDAVDIAYNNVGHLPRLHIIQSDIRKLPFTKIFDFVFSVGVLHHMEDPQAGFTSIVECLKPDGSVCVWVYGQENNWWIINLIGPLRKTITTKLPVDVLKMISTTLSVPVYATSKILAKPYNALSKKLPWLPEFFYQTYFAYIARFDFTEINHIVFDHLIAPIAYYIPKKDLESWFSECRFANPVIRWHNKNSWTGFASLVEADLSKMHARTKQVTTIK